MEKFSAAFRSRFPRPEDLDSIENSCGELEALKRARIDVPTLVPEFYERGNMPRLPVKLMILMQNAIRRALELAESMIRDSNAFRYTPVYTSARSLFELASLIFDTYERMYAVSEKWDMRAYLEFNEHLDHVILGWKSETWHPGRDKPDELELRAKNILTIIQRIDKKIPRFFGLYELLSEVAHPNYMGMMEAYCKLGPEFLSIEFFDSPTQADPERVAPALSCAEGALDMLASTIRKFEDAFVSFTKGIAEQIRDPSSDEAIRAWDKPIR